MWPRHLYAISKSTHHSHFKLFSLKKDTGENLYFKKKQNSNSVRASLVQNLFLKRKPCHSVLCIEPIISSPFYQLFLFHIFPVHFCLSLLITQNTHFSTPWGKKKRVWGLFTTNVLTLIRSKLVSTLYEHTKARDSRQAVHHFWEVIKIMNTSLRLFFFWPIFAPGISKTKNPSKEYKFNKQVETEIK